MINAIVIIGIILVLCGIFYWLILPLLKYSGKVSHKISETVLPELLELDKTIITICSAAIILTINLIDKSIIGINYLIASWISLIACIGIGVLLLLVCYTYRVTGKVSLSEVKAFGKESKNMTKNTVIPKSKEVLKILHHHSFLFIYWCHHYLYHFYL
jgi:magnesium-transporting ATPase (P-type)